MIQQDQNILAALEAAKQNPANILEAGAKECKFYLEREGSKHVCHIRITSSIGEAKVDVIMDDVMIGGWHYSVQNEGDFGQYLVMQEALSEVRAAHWEHSRRKKDELASWFWYPNQKF